MSVKMALLEILEDGPRNGYQLRTEFEARTGAVWPLNVGQVYTTLDRLERDGLVAEVVTETRERNQRTFAVTGAGQAALQSWYGSSAPNDAPRDELLIKLLVVLDDPPAAQGVIDAQRRMLYARLQSHRRAAPTGDLAAELVHDALAVRTEADLRWLDRCEARLREAGQDHNRCKEAAAT